MIGSHLARTGGQTAFHELFVPAQHHGTSPSPKPSLAATIQHVSAEYTNGE
jgi:hypothetical protein